MQEFNDEFGGIELMYMWECAYFELLEEWFIVQNSLLRELLLSFIL